MTVINIPKRKTWTEYLTNMEIDSELKTAYSKQGTIASLITNRISLVFPDRKYTTRKSVEGEETYLIITRTK